MCALKNGKSNMLNKNGKYHLPSSFHYSAILTKVLKRLELALNRYVNKWEISIISCTNTSTNLILMLPSNLKKQSKK